jgi:predicted Na+-dependent transporter
MPSGGSNVSVVRGVVTSAAHGDVLAWVILAMAATVLGMLCVTIPRLVMRRPAEERQRAYLPWGIAMVLLGVLVNILISFGMH